MPEVILESGSFELEWRLYCTGCPWHLATTATDRRCTLFGHPLAPNATPPRLAACLAEEGRLRDLKALAQRSQL
jgi:hypothetical protein